MNVQNQIFRRKSLAQPCEALRQLKTVDSEMLAKSKDLIVAKEGLASGVIERHRLQRERQA